MHEWWVSIITGQGVKAIASFAILVTWELWKERKESLPKQKQNATSTPIENQRRDESLVSRGGDPPHGHHRGLHFLNVIPFVGTGL